MTQSNKDTALALMSLLIEGKIEEAYARYINMDGKHHNIYFPAGFAALKQAMIEDYERNPNKRQTIHNVLADGDLVAVHSHIEFAAGNPGASVTHIFRFEGDKVVEMWDCVMLLSEDSPNSDGAF